MLRCLTSSRSPESQDRDASKSAIPLPTATSKAPRPGRRFNIGWSRFAALALSVYLSYFLVFRVLRVYIKDRIIDASNPLEGYCAHVAPIVRDEYLGRQDALAQTLHAVGGSAYIAEPGASAAYFANLTGRAWGLSERPLLLIVSHDFDVEGAVVPTVTVLTPTFEESRARQLNITAGRVRWAAWDEDANPYAAALSALPAHARTKDAKIFVDGAVRHFVVDGLQKVMPDARVLVAPKEVRQLRERKSPKELEILTCANEATVLAIRSVRRKMKFGIRESETRKLVQEALTSAGLVNSWPLVLFGENAALPHGSGTDRALRPEDFVLIDCGGSLHGYQSDITRTFALHQSKISDEQLLVWHTVQEAQAAAAKAATNGTVTSAVDAAARKVIADAGYGKYFTHRLGHGIGLEVHEEPYLVGGSTDVIATGHSFSNEPGVYIEGKIGVRLEDCWYSSYETGQSVYLTTGVGGPARSPWSP